MSDAVRKGGSYLLQMDDARLSALAEVLSPSLRERLARHLLCATPAGEEDGIALGAVALHDAPPLTLGATRRSGAATATTAASSSSDASAPAAAPAAASFSTAAPASFSTAAPASFSTAAPASFSTAAPAYFSTAASAACSAAPRANAAEAGEEFSPAELSPPDALLFSAQQMQTLLPALTPGAQRWLCGMQHASRQQAQQQKAVKTLSRYVEHTEQLRSDAEEERRRLRQLVQRQSAALAANTRQMQALRAAHESKAAALQAEMERSRLLERSLRAACRYREAAAEAPQ
ncbi:hypothetical protein AB1Y20_005166 [Prymnesium parvum]|uniref:Uncharacterized protein n=1 Tax=Prymnesium parvum TaxID=97485 RepID=A0AB34J3D5_PRYPA